MLQSNIEPDSSTPQHVDEPLVEQTPARLPYDTAKAVGFLCSLVPAGRIAVAEIAPDKAGCRGETFTLPDELQEMGDWIEAGQGRRNLYYTLNEPVPREQQRGSAGRLCKGDIKTIRGIPVDLDPRGDVEAEPGGFLLERERLRQILLEWKDTTAGPAAFVDSGGGVQGIFLLSEPLLATAENVAAVEAQGRALAQLYGGDNVQSIEHLLRIPFTINLPHAKKRAKGRVPAETRGKVLEPLRRHSLADLARLVPPLPLAAPANTAVPSDLAAAWYVIGCPDNLDSKLAERIAIARAMSPLFDRLLLGDEPGSDRSKHDYSLAATCVDCGFTERGDIADIVAAYGSQKVEERGVPYIALTVESALRKASRPEDHFSRIEDEARASAKGGADADLAEPVDIFGDDDPAHLSTPPAGSLPKVIEAFVRTIAIEMGVPESFVAVPAVAALAGAIGNSLMLYPREHSTSWRVPAAFPVVIVAPPGRKKSPTLAAVLSPHRAIDLELRRVGARDRAAWDALHRSAKGKVTSTAPPMPPQRQVLVDDATLEKQIRVHADNPRGIIRAPDELVAWLGSMGAYKRNGDGDRGTMLRLLDGGPVSMERVSGSVFADSALMGLIATTQPDKMRMLARDLGADGMLQRFVFVVDDGVERTPLDVPTDDAARSEYEQAVRGMFAIDHTVDGKVHLSAEARAILADTWRRVRALQRLPGSSAAWEGHISKWEGLIYRIALTFHAIETYSFFGNVPVGPTAPVSAATARMVSRFVAFLIGHALRFYSKFYEPAEHTAEAQNIAGFLLTRPDILSVTPRDIEKARRSLQGKRRETLAAMSDLENAGWVSVSGRDPSGPTKWTINPKIHDRFADRAEREKVHRAKAREQVLAAMSAQRELRDAR